MYLDCKVKIPETQGKITVKTIRETPYVYLETGRKYIKEKKYNTPKRTCIGKQLILNGKNEKANRYLRESVVAIRHALASMSVAVFEVTTSHCE